MLPVLILPTDPLFPSSDVPVSIVMFYKFCSGRAALVIAFFFSFLFIYLEHKTSVYKIK